MSSPRASGGGGRRGGRPSRCRSARATRPGRAAEVLSREGRQSLEAGTGDPAGVLQVRPQRAGTVGGDLVGPPALLLGQRPDQFAALQAGEGGVERTRAEGGPGQFLDVLDEGVAVLRPAGEAGQDKDAGVGEPAEVIHGTLPYIVARYSVPRTSASGRDGGQ